MYWGIGPRSTGRSTVSRTMGTNRRATGRCRTMEAKWVNTPWISYEIHGVFTHFASIVRQRPVARRFVPMVLETVERPVERGPMPQYIFEPEPEKLLGELLPRYIETRVYNALLEAAAAE